MSLDTCVQKMHKSSVKLFYYLLIGTRQSLIITNLKSISNILLATQACVCIVMYVDSTGNRVCGVSATATKGSLANSCYKGNQIRP